MFYEKDIDGLWRENEFATGKLSELELVDNRLFFNMIAIRTLLENAKAQFIMAQDTEKERRAQAAYLRKERQKHLLEEQERKRQEREQENRKQAEESQRNIESALADRETPAIDAKGTRWVKCKNCGKIAPDREFAFYGGAGEINLGTCRVCADNSSAVSEILQKIELRRKRYDPAICPDCGGKLQERSGVYGRFLGCMNYPRCKYSRSVK